MILPEHVCRALGIGGQATEDELASLADASSFTQDVFGLSGQEFAIAASMGLNQSLRFRVAPTIRPTQEWKYLELLNLGATECMAVLTPADTTEKPSTAAGQALAAAWIANPMVMTGNAITAQSLVSGHQVGGVPSDFSLRLIGEWAEACPLFVGSVACPAWISKTQITLDPSGKIKGANTHGQRFEALFLEAISEVKAKWRFLSIYRVLEHGYLSEVFQTIQAGFFASPKETLEAGLNSLESEVKQFVALVNAAGLTGQFEVFHDEFDQCKTGGNRFSTALDHSITKGGQIKQLTGKWQKGVLLFYKVRCAVVHAGIASPMFDAYPDGPACLEKLLPTCEQIMFDFLGVSMA